MTEAQTLRSDENEPSVAAVVAVLEQVKSVLSHLPSALVTDIDGTISPIAPTPASAAVHPDAKQALAVLVGVLPTVAVITGRAAEDAERMLGLDNVIYIGNHGLERRWKGTTRDHSEAVKSIEAIRAALAQIEHAVQDEHISEGLLLENKRLSASIHYRLSPARDEIGPRIGAIVAMAATSNGLRMTEGRYVYELRPWLTVNKGTAVLDLIEDRELKGIAFLGDDVTDVDAFREIRRATKSGLVEGLAIAVNSPEVRPVVLAEADASVEGVTGAATLLVELAKQLTAAPTRDGVD